MWLYLNWEISQRLFTQSAKTVIGSNEAVATVVADLNPRSSRALAKVVAAIGGSDEAMAMAVAYSKPQLSRATAMCHI